MKDIVWDPAKNALLKETRSITFNQIEIMISKGEIEVIENPSSNHKNQKMFLVQIHDYIYLVPFVETDSEICLKTIIPSRKWTKKRKEK